MSSDLLVQGEEKTHAGVTLEHSDANDHRLDEETVFGFWVFLMSDAVLFALLFATYASMTGRLAGGPSGRDLFTITPVFVETIVLLASTLTFGFASAALKAKARARVLIWLALTGCLGLTFLFIEYRDLTALVAKGAGPQRSGYWSALWVLLGTHGVHVAIGLLWLGVMMIQVGVLDLNARVRSRVLRLGLFWHFLDVVWVAIFSIVYLSELAA